jgi:hypothetical protein
MLWKMRNVGKNKKKMGLRRKVNSFNKFIIMIKKGNSVLKQLDKWFKECLN